MTLKRRTHSYMNDNAGDQRMQLCYESSKKEANDKLGFFWQNVIVIYFTDVSSHPAKRMIRVQM